MERTRKEQEKNKERTRKVQGNNTAKSKEKTRISHTSAPVWSVLSTEWIKLQDEKHKATRGQVKQLLVQFLAPTRDLSRLLPLPIYILTQIEVYNQAPVWDGVDFDAGCEIRRHGRDGDGQPRGAWKLCCGSTHGKA